MSMIVPLRRMRHGDVFRATSLRLPQSAQSPFIGVDHAWMSGPVFPPHQHAALSAVSYVFLDSESGINNRDNIGTQNYIAPGGLHWTAAGKGIVHEEVPAAAGKTVHSLQIFVGLSEQKQNMPPAALILEAVDVPVVNIEGCKVRIPVGSFNGVKSPLLPPTDVTILDITLEKGAEIDIPVPSGHSAFILPIFGETRINGQEFNHNDLKVPAYLPQEIDGSIRVETPVETGKIVFFSGLPLNQQ